MADGEFKIPVGPRMRGGSLKTSVEDWLQFLTAGGRYDKTIRTLEDAKTSDRPVVLYPDTADVTQYYAYKREGDVSFLLKYDGGVLKEVMAGVSLIEEPTRSILLSELKSVLGIQAGGRRRHSRKAGGGPH